MNTPQKRHDQVTEVIRERIRRGVWKPRRRIPSQADLAEEFEMSGHTISRAIASLREAGYLWTLRHKGSYARPPEDWRQLAE
jgi:DNA-binding GntR family transcriptional regulator